MGTNRQIRNLLFSLSSDYILTTPRWGTVTSATLSSSWQMIAITIPNQSPPFIPNISGRIISLTPPDPSEINHPERHYSNVNLNRGAFVLAPAGPRRGTGLLLNPLGFVRWERFPDLNRP